MLEMAFDKALQSLESLRGQRCMWCVAWDFLDMAFLQLVHLVSHQFFKKLPFALSMLRQNMNRTYFFKLHLHSWILVSHTPLLSLLGKQYIGWVKKEGKMWEITGQRCVSEILWIYHLLMFYLYRKWDFCFQEDGVNILFFLFLPPNAAKNPDIMYKTNIRRLWKMKKRQTT